MLDESSVVGIVHTDIAAPICATVADNWLFSEFLDDKAARIGAIGVYLSSLVHLLPDTPKRMGVTVLNCCRGAVHVIPISASVAVNEQDISIIEL